MIGPRIAAAMVAGMALLATPAVQAQQLVVATYGGSFADDTKSCHIQAFEKATGAKVVLQLGNSVQIAAAIRAGGGTPPYDIGYLDDSLATQLNGEGLIAPIDTGKLANYPDIAKQAWGPGNSYVNFMTAATVIAYNPDVVKTPPTSWNDLFDPKYAGRMALGDITGTSGLHFLLAVNRMRGGTLDNMDPGLAALKGLVKNTVTLYTQADQLISLFQRGEVVIAPWYPDRAGSAADKGLKIAVAYPQEGAVGIKPTLVIPKGAKDADLALKYIDTVLSVDGQSCFAEKKYAGPVNAKVKLSDKVAKLVPVGETYERLWYPDPAAVAAHLPEWQRRWQREVTR
ncbi:ABC transporter substrate-binding protein [Limobrevibacterium gyesilva]|uniref:ABC transporter substrate-binding protein n=1 Tax=Limobrevibacterium gyesilva TaxID=2991712 RepID=A0AA42CGB0_9PROT|nr:ABC transporter substrate-binding protein [Limobrevibacterium gyesilva]MCW3475861.1 ABC transporter substrate-binding protein [Limobrevibacterium gyesilva]